MWKGQSQKYLDSLPNAVLEEFLEKRSGNSDFIHLGSR